MLYTSLYIGKERQYKMCARRKIIVLLCVICIVFANLVGCGKKDFPKPVSGKYVSVDGNSYIVIGEYSAGKSEKFDEVLGYCDIQFTNVDLSPFSEFSVINGTSVYIAINDLGGKLSSEEVKEIKKKFESNIDLNKQFVENKAKFGYFYSENEKGYGFLCEIEGSGFDGAYECYVAMEYIAKEKTIICEEIKYILEE